jgi:hypothetical protein
MSFEYAKLSVPQKWQWHAEVYALRRVMLGVSHDERISPCDTKGEWFDERLVAAAEQRYRARIAEQLRVCRTSTDAANAIRFAKAETWRSSADVVSRVWGFDQPRATAQSMGVTARESADLNHPRAVECK